MSLANKIYDKLPIFLQNMAMSIYGYKLKKERYGKEYYNYKKYLSEYDNLSRQGQEKIQIEELKKLIEYTVKNSIFYKKLYENIDINSINSIEDLKKLPIVTKEMIRENIDDIITIDKKDGIKSNTGGTTGKSMTIYFIQKDVERRMATLDYFKEKHGFKNIEMKKATFNGKHIIPSSNKKNIYWRYNSAVKQRMYSSFHITEENMKYYVDDLNKFKPHSIDGFFSSIYEIASYIERNNIKLTFTPLVIFPTSETITPREKEVIERVFKCKVRNQYASSEGAPFINECSCGSLHYETATGIFEYLEEGSNEVLVTSFTTYGTPLIRYKIGDSIENLNNINSCRCGVSTPIVDNVLGRQVDFLYATNGAKINLGNISNAFKYIPNAIVKSQIIQEKMNEIEISIVIDKNLYKEKYSKLIIDEFKGKFGIDMIVKLNIVEDIPREKSGKHRFIINKVNNII